MRSRFGVVLKVAATVTLCSATAAGQGVQTSTLSGTVFDTSKAVLTGASVTLAGPGLIGGPRTILTDDHGAYRFSFLSPGEYEVTAARVGFVARKVTGIKLLVDTGLDVDFQLPLASLTENANVTERVPLVDVRASATPFHLDRNLLQNLPTNRDVPSLINLVPGVANGVGFGGSQGGNALYVDGVYNTDPKIQEPGVPFNYNWVEQVQVAAIGASAEYGEFTGVAANAVIKSGSNNFSGLGEYWTTRPNWVGSNTASAAAEQRQQFEPLRNVTFWETSAQVGGPFVLDRLWFFSGVEASKHDTQPPGYSGPDSTRTWDRRAITKLSAAVSPRIRIEGFVQYAWPKTIADGLGPFQPAETTNDDRTNQTTWSGRTTWAVAGRTFLEAKGGGYASQVASDPHGPGTRAGPPVHYDIVTDMLSANSLEWRRSAADQNSAAVSLTHFAEDFVRRSHEFKFGLDYKWSENRDEFGIPGGARYEDMAGEPYLALISDGGHSQVNTKRTALYARDDWALGSRITVNLGVRADVTRASVLIPGTVFSTAPISSRIGAAWDLSGDHRSVIRAHYGRYHDPIFTHFVGALDRSDTSQPNIYARVVAPGVFREFDRDIGPQNKAIDSRIHQSFVDQYVIGGEHEIWRDTSLIVQYIHRRFGNFMGVIDTGSIWEPVQRQDPGPDGLLSTSDDGPFLTLYRRRTKLDQQFFVLANPPAAFRRYDALQVVATKRYAHNWQLQASVTWANTRGNVGNSYHTNASLYTLDNNTLGGNVENVGVFANPNGQINADGRVALDYSEFKALGTYRAPWWGGLNLSSVYTLHSGSTWSRIAVFTGLLGGEVQAVRMEPSGIRRLPSTDKIDVRVEKTVPVLKRGRLGLFVDLFNLNNQGVPLGRLALSGPRFGQPGEWSAPRTLQIGVRYIF